MKVVIIGGGPAGMMAGISAARNGNEVVILEKMNMLGKKLLITGKGRCNITSSLDISEFIPNIPGNGRFLYSCFEQFTNKDIIKLMEKHNVKVKEERGNRIFPVSDKSIDVLNAFLDELKMLKVKIVTGAKVEKILTEISMENNTENVEQKNDTKNPKKDEDEKEDSKEENQIMNISVYDDDNSDICKDNINISQINDKNKSNEFINNLNLKDCNF